MEDNNKTKLIFNEEQYRSKVFIYNEVGVDCLCITNTNLYYMALKDVLIETFDAKLCFLDIIYNNNEDDESLDIKETGDYIYKSENMLIKFSLGNIRENTDDDIDDEYDSGVLLNLEFFIKNNEVGYKQYEDIKLFLDDSKDYIKDLGDSPTLYYIGMENGELQLSPERLDEVEVDIELNYGSAFALKYDKIYNALSEGSSGLVLFHGEPGSGKTTLIKYLIQQLHDKKDIIYVPSHMMESIANVEFISFMRNIKNSILILEDAENVLTDRTTGAMSQAVGNILNLTNGLLNDGFKIQIIATFNMDKQKIDKALLREGRLIEEHEFGKLTASEATKLSKELDFNIEYTKDIVLAEVYGGVKEDKPKKAVKKKIGF